MGLGDKLMYSLAKKLLVVAVVPMFKVFLPVCLQIAVKV